jgi:hypothetical protein
MKYLIELMQTQLSDIKQLIDLGKYQNVAQFISTAIDNQIYLENCDTPEESHLPIDKITSILDKTLSPKKENSQREYVINNIPASIPTVPMPEFHQLAMSTYIKDEETCLLWGQVNRIFPIKIGLRILAIRMNKEGWLELEEYKNTACDVAELYAHLLKKHETKNNRNRELKISAALPEIKDYKSQMRYKGQFLAYIRKDGRLEGASTFLKLVNIKKDEQSKVLIGLTKAGLEFARLENPVLDEENFERSLSKKEIEFYLGHISREVKGEFNMVKWLLKTIAGGVNRREAINNELKQQLGLKWGNPSEAIINTQRSGLTARMNELGLLGKEKHGVTGIYTITELGRKYL